MWNCVEQSARHHITDHSNETGQNIKHSRVRYGYFADISWGSTHGNTRDCLQRSLNSADLLLKVTNPSLTSLLLVFTSHRIGIGLRLRDSICTKGYYEGRPTLVGSAC
eukprot:3928730-Pyramimonas_sp.AAC.2